jgi:hypothetical protein
VGESWTNRWQSALDESWLYEFYKRLEEVNWLVGEITLAADSICQPCVSSDVYLRVPIHFERFALAAELYSRSLGLKYRRKRISSTWFGTRGSEVQILSPRPIISNHLQQQLDLQNRPPGFAPDFTKALERSEPHKHSTSSVAQRARPSTKSTTAP